jgi:hypothetical protein
MNLIVALAIAALMPLSAGAADRKPLEIKVVDDRVSIHAEAVPLGRLLGLLDRTAGTTSTVPPELANRNVSTQFAGLPLDQAVKKVFEGLPLDYVVLEGTQIVVTAVSQSLTGQAQAAAPPRASNPQPFVSPNRAPTPAPQNPFQARGNPNPAVGGNRNAGNAPAQPAVIQTPFGPLVNPRANQNQQQQPGMPMAMPGQAGFPFGARGASPTGLPTSPGGTMSPSDYMRLQQGAPGATPGRPGAQPGPQPNVFGNTSPTILDLNKKSPNPPQPEP